MRLGTLRRVDVTLLRDAGWVGLLALAWPLLVALVFGWLLRRGLLALARRAHANRATRMRARVVEVEVRVDDHVDARFLCRLGVGEFGQAGNQPLYGLKFISLLTGVYGIDSGRICVAALNSKNIDHAAASIAKVL